MAEKKSLGKELTKGFIIENPDLLALPAPVAPASMPVAVEKVSA